MNNITYPAMAWHNKCNTTDPEEKSASPHIGKSGLDKKSIAKKGEKFAQKNRIGLLRTI
jgi:hypothetical protein